MDWNKYILQKNNKLNKEDIGKFLAFINSVLGMMNHYNSYKLRKKILIEEISIYFYNYFYIDFNYKKVYLRK